MVEDLEPESAQLTPDLGGPDSILFVTSPRAISVVSHH